MSTKVTLTVPNRQSNHLRFKKLIDSESKIRDLYLYIFNGHNTVSTQLYRNKSKSMATYMDKLKEQMITSGQIF
jgi:hypothetical protein